MKEIHEYKWFESMHDKFLRCCSSWLVLDSGNKVNHFYNDFAHDIADACEAYATEKQVEILDYFLGADDQRYGVVSTEKIIEKRNELLSKKNELD